MSQETVMDSDAARSCGWAECDNRPGGTYHCVSAAVAAAQQRDGADQWERMVMRSCRCVGEAATGKKMTIHWQSLQQISRFGSSVDF